MSRHIQEIRDQLDRGSRVYMLVKTSGMIKRHPGTVYEVVRAGARVRLDNGRELTVRFKELELMPGPQPGGPPAIDVTSKAGIAPPVTRVRAPEPPPPPPPRPATPPPPAVAPAPPPAPPPRALLPAPTSRVAEVRSSLQAWLEMGKDLARDADEHIDLLVTSRDGLVAEQSALADELKALDAEIAALRAVRNRVEADRG
jgi:hypothetical protein